ncbi:MAG: hypothetical protein AAFW65_01615 [Pseudomonadota bacterium]
MSDNDFFIGWAEEAPEPDRRFFLGAGLGLMTTTAGLAGSLAVLQQRPGAGTWNQGAVREWTGIITGQPYAMLRTVDIDGTPKTALLSCLGKCGVAARVGSLEGQPVVVKGSLIQRGKHAMIAVADGMDWIKPLSEPLPADLAFPDLERVGPVSLVGEILDPKCWFGAMRPSEGKVHKSCAALCIRGGLPPAFYAKTQSGTSALMIMTDAGDAHGEALLPFVADPVKVSGQVRRWGDLLLLDNPVSAIKRI